VARLAAVSPHRECGGFSICGGGRGVAGDDLGNPDNAIPKRGRREGRARLPWRRDPVILARLVEVERRNLIGERNTAIALALKVDEQTIRADLSRIRELWLEDTKAEIAALKARKVAELEEVKRQAFGAAAFDEMCERAVLFNEPFVGKDGKAGRVYRDSKGSAQFRGNKAAALGQARAAIMDQAKVLGLVVDKVSPTDDEGHTLDLATLLQRARALREARDGDGDVGATTE
jgi:hypothetical protein